MAYRLAFGADDNDYVFPESLTYNLVSFGSAVPSAKLPRAHGARVPTGYLAERRIEIRGLLKKEIGGDTLQTQLDALRAALMTGPTSLWLPNSRHLRNVQKDDSASDRFENTWPERIVEVSVDLVTGDPFLYSDTESEDINNTITATGDNVVVNNAAGNAPALPVIELTMDATGTLAATITNETTGEIFTLSGSVTDNDVIVVDSLNETVTISGTDRTDLFDGLFPTLALGNNTFDIAFTSGDISNVDFTWRSRWY